MATTRNKTDYSGVYWRESSANGQEDKIFYIVYRDENNKTIEVKVGKESDGIDAEYANNKRTEIINKSRT